MEVEDLSSVYPVSKSISLDVEHDVFTDMICPLCGERYSRVENLKRIDGEDNYKAWVGRGDCVKVLFESECGSLWYLCFGFHKGITQAFIEVLDSCSSLD